MEKKAAKKRRPAKVAQDNQRPAKSALPPPRPEKSAESSPGPAKVAPKSTRPEKSATKNPERTNMLSRHKDEIQRPEKEAREHELDPQIIYYLDTEISNFKNAIIDKLIKVEKQKKRPRTRSKFSPSPSHCGMPFVFCLPLGHFFCLGLWNLQPRHLGSCHKCPTMTFRGHVRQTHLAAQAPFSQARAGDMAGITPGKTDEIVGLKNGCKPIPPSMPLPFLAFPQFQTIFRWNPFA